MLFVECSPETSVPFWLRMGFRLVKGGLPRKQYAIRLIPKTFCLPDEGEKVEVVVEWFAARRKLQESVNAARTQRIAGVLFEDIIDLEARVAEFHLIDGEHACLRITVDGLLWYFDKAKYSQAEELGVRLGVHGIGFYFDHLFLPEKLPFVPDW